MKSLLMLILFTVFFTSVSHGTPVGDIRLKVKILSFDQHWVQAESSGKRVEVPRSAFNGLKILSGEEREVSLSQNQYTLLRLLMAQSESMKSSTN